MPPKRTWSQANGDGASASPASRARISALRANADTSVPSISRKVTACASCRKQKIRCIMDDKGPPCRRCTERGLSCVLNKSLQTLIEERSLWKETVIDDLNQMHSSLQQVLAKLSLPRLPSLRTSDAQEQSYDRHIGDEEEEALTYDDSPTQSPVEDSLPHAPIESLYEITRLKTLRTDEATNGLSDRAAAQPLDDFISTGMISVEDAERLVDRFINRIDHFMYKIGAGPHRSLDSLRRRSPVLTAAICAVAALHDPNGTHLYIVCGREFRRLMSASMFNRRLSQDCMRAMCVAAYWLHDLSWMISGYAIRRAMELNLSQSYQQVLTQSDEEAMGNVRIWYLLFICDRHLSVLYGRPSIVRDDDESISGWRSILRSSLCSESDKRLLGQLDLLKIMCRARDLFGPDTGEPIPARYAKDLEIYSGQIDEWLQYWCGMLLKTHENLGDFPLKGARIHHYLAKLHLHSHVFRGLKGSPVPEHFYSSAVAAVDAAISIIDMVLNDENIRQGLSGIPHYIHSMIAYACVFLLKTSAQYPGTYLESNTAIHLTTRAVQQFRATPVSERHLIQLMAEGLEKMVARRTARALSETEPMITPNGTMISAPATSDPNLLYQGDGVNQPLESGNVLNFDDTLDFGTASFLNFDTGTLALDFTGFEF